MKLIVALALAAIAPAQEDVYTQSWSSSHWSIIAMKGDAPERVAVLVDRESVRTGATPNLREVSFLSTVEGMPSRWGIIARVRIDCEAKTLLELGRVQFSAGGGRKDIPPPTDTMSPIAPDSALYGVVAGICDGDWRGPTAVDVPAARIGPALFKS